MSQSLDSSSPHDPEVRFLERIAGGFFREQRLIVLIIALIVVAGLSSLAVMPRMEDPVLTPRVALVVTRLPGANARRVEALVTEKIESALRDVMEIHELSSISRAGISTITVELRDTIYETDSIWAKVRSRVEDAIPNLPPDASRPVFDELDARAYSMILGIVWDQPGPTDYRVLRRLAIDLQDKIQNSTGTEVVDRFGDPGEEIEVQIDPVRASSLRLSLATLARRIANYDAKKTAGQLRNQPNSMLIDIENQLRAIDNIANIPIASRDGKDVRLSEVGKVSLGLPKPATTTATLNGKDAVVLAAMVRNDTRIDRWTENINKLLSEHSPSLPAGIAIDRVLVQNDYVADRLKTLTNNLVIGATGVAVVIFLMMGWRSALIVTLTLPLASLMVLFGMRVYGIPIHQMSVTGLVIAFGLLIDNSIVVVDEVKGRLQKQMRPIDAMTSSVRHLAIPLLGSTLTTAFAFAPIALTPGAGGEFVGAIAVGVIMAIASSFVLAVTVIPTVAARFLDAGREPTNVANRRTHFARHGISLPRAGRVFERFIRVCLSRPWVGVATGLCLPLMGFSLASTLDEQFFPPTDRNQFHIQVDLPITASISETRNTARQIDLFVREHGAKRVDWFFGGSAPEFYYNVVGDREGQPNFAQAIVTLNDDVNPKRTIRKLQAVVDENFLKPRILVRQLEQGPPFEAPIEVRIFGPELRKLRQLGDEVRRRVNNLSEVVAVRTDLAEVLPQLSFKIDESVASAAGITPAEVADQLATTLEGVTGGSVLQNNEQLPIVIRVGPDDRGSLARIENLELMLSAEATTAERPPMTPVSSMTSVSLVPESAAIPRLDRQRMNKVSVYIQAGVLPSRVQSQLEESLARKPLDLPDGYHLSYGGEGGERDEAVGNLLSTVGLLAVMMVATLVLSFRSFRMASIIGLVGVLSIGLALLALAIGGYPFGFVAIIGTMGLLGVAINDSIVVLACIRSDPEARSGNIDRATYQILHATRHVIATTVTTIAGFAPLIIGGGDFWPPLAVAISGGVAGASILALVLVPSLHQWLVASPMLRPTQTAAAPVDSAQAP